MNYVPAEKEVFEILEEFSKETTKKKRIEVLRKYEKVNALRDLLQGCFDDRLQFSLPEGKPPYTPNLPQSTPSSLLREHRQFGFFVKGGPGKDMPQYRIEQLFINLLESIHAEDALLVCKMVNKETPVPYLTKKLTEEAFPNLLPAST